MQVRIRAVPIHRDDLQVPAEVPGVQPRQRQPVPVPRQHHRPGAGAVHVQQRAIRRRVAAQGGTKHVSCLIKGSVPLFGKQACCVCFERRDSDNCTPRCRFEGLEGLGVTPPPGGGAFEALLRQGLLMTRLHATAVQHSSRKGAAPPYRGVEIGPDALQATAPDAAPLVRDLDGHVLRPLGVAAQHVAFKMQI
jgi:hypothetical protein